MAVIGTVLVILGCLDEIREGFHKLAACRARREEMKKITPTETMAGQQCCPGRFHLKDPRDEARPRVFFLFSPRLP